MFGGHACENCAMRSRIAAGASAAAIVAGLAYAGWRAWRARVPHRTRGVAVGTRRRSRSRPCRVAAHGGAGAAPRTGRSIPNLDGTCPATHPVKAKLASGIYHLPGGSTTTAPTRPLLRRRAAAEADGLRPTCTRRAGSKASTAGLDLSSAEVDRAGRLHARLRGDLSRPSRATPASRWRAPSARPRRSGSGPRPCRRC